MVLNPTNLVTKKQGSFSLLDASLVAVAKSTVVDRFADPLVKRFTRGNILFDILAKVGLASISTMAKGKNMSRAGNIIATALMVSAGDRISDAFFGSPITTANKSGTQEVLIGGGADFGDSNKTGREGESFI